MLDGILLEQDEGARTFSSVSGVGNELNDESGKPIWKNRVESWKEKENEKKALAKKAAAKAQAPPVEEQIIDEREAVIIMRLIVLGLFFHYRITNPVYSAFDLWMTSDICEIWFAFSWILDQFPKWRPINRETYVDRLIAWFTSTYYLMKYISSISRILFFLRHS